MRNNSPTHKSVLQFLLEAGRLKSEARRGWILKVGITRPESVADHSYRTTLMAMLFADLRGLDTLRAMKMAILHDLPEAIVGDAMPGETSAIQRRAHEQGAIEHLLSNLPAPVKSQYSALWQELTENNSDEAKMVRELDKLEMAIQAHEYVKLGFSKTRLREFLATAREAVKDDLLRELLSLL